MTTTYSFKEIWDTIKTYMDQIKNTDLKVWAVYNHDIKIENWISLPAIVITPSNWAVNLLDSCSYENQINYTVRLFDRTQSNYADIEDNMRVVADMVLQKLKKIWTIAWNNSDGKTANEKLEIYIPHNSWVRELNWQKYSLSQLGFERVSSFSTKRINIWIS